MFCLPADYPSLHRLILVRFTNDSCSLGACNLWWGRSCWRNVDIDSSLVLTVPERSIYRQERLHPRPTAQRIVSSLLVQGTFLFPLLSFPKSENVAFFVLNVCTRTVFFRVHLSAPWGACVTVTTNDQRRLIYFSFSTACDCSNDLIRRLLLKGLALGMDPLSLTSCITYSSARTSRI